MVRTIQSRNAVRPRPIPWPVGLCAAALILLGVPFATAQLLEPEPTRGPETPGFLALGVIPSLSIPLGDSGVIFHPGGSLRLAGEYTFPEMSILTLSALLDYRLNMARLAEPVAMHVVAAGVGAGIDIPFLPFFGLKIQAAAGGYASFAIPDPLLRFGFNPFLEGGAGLYFYLTDTFWLNVGASYRYDFGLYDGLGINLSAGVTLPAAGKTLRGVRTAAMQAGGTGDILESADRLLVGEIELEPVFPVLFTYYFTHPIGVARIRNPDNSPMEEIRVKLINRQYMEAARESAPFTLAPEESRMIDLDALFTDAVLAVTEGTTVAVEAQITYTQDGRRHVASSVESLRIYGRNSMTWDPDWKAAAFITAKDPVILGFAKHSEGMVTDFGNQALNARLSTAMAMHAMLRSMGLRYSVDPLSSYAELSTRKSQVDFLQFPRETLRYKAGDCDDLTLLYCALLESVGVETALVTVPGHIYMAFSLDMQDSEARSLFSDTGDLIFDDEGKTWVPLEVTEIEGGFLKAWETGAREWRENESSDTAELYPVHAAWIEYQPVGLPGDETLVVGPPPSDVSPAFQREQVRLIEREIVAKVEALRQDILSDPRDPRPVNRLGVLYARWGLYEQAVEQFLKATELQEYAPSLLNLGNISLVRKDPEQALSYYEAASRLNPDSADAILGMARANHEMENFATARKLHTELVTVNDDLAERFAYLGQRGDDSARAADVERTRSQMVWVEE